MRRHAPEIEAFNSLFEMREAWRIRGEGRRQVSFNSLFEMRNMDLEKCFNELVELSILYLRCDGRTGYAVVPISFYFQFSI